MFADGTYYEFYCASDDIQGISGPRDGGPEEVNSCKLGGPVILEWVDVG